MANLLLKFTWVGDNTNTRKTDQNGGYLHSIGHMCGVACSFCRSLVVRLAAHKSKVSYAQVGTGSITDSETDEEVTQMSIKMFLKIIYVLSHCIACAFAIARRRRHRTDNEPRLQRKGSGEGVQACLLFISDNNH